MSGQLAVAKVGLVVCAFAFFNVASASHFRYGTLSYIPLEGQTAGDGKQLTQITFKAAFRRDYPWGRFAGEEWAQLTNANSFSKPSDDAWKTLSRDSELGVNTAPQFDHPSSITNDWNGNGIGGEKFFIKFPPFNANLNSDLGEYVYACPGAFYCDHAKPGTTCTTADCYDANWNPSLCADNTGSYVTGCATWSDMYGMYLGDGTSRTVELTTTSIDYSCADGDSLCNSITGNFLFGEEVFQHGYNTNTAEPYQLYFTGGQRIYECLYDPGIGKTGLSADGTCVEDLDRLLNNNAEGRYRLIMDVWILGDFNRSPIASQLPVLPVVRSTSFDTRTLFQIAAYDPDVEDKLVFAFGDETEMGAISRSKSVQYPYKDGVKNTSYNQFGDLKCTATNRVFLETGKCPDDRAPTGIPGTEDSFSSLVEGLVSWRTYYDDGTPLPVGLYNMVVMIHDYQPVWETSDADIKAAYEADANRKVLWKKPGIEVPYKAKVPLDFMLYLYDGNLGFCNRACKDNKLIDIESSLLGTSNGPADSDYPGIQTFADKDGIYGIQTAKQLTDTYAYPGGAIAPFTDLDKGLKRYAQRCTICGYGVMNASMCTPFEADNVCGEMQGASLVPTASACQTNTPPQFRYTEDLGGRLSNPLVEVYHENLNFVHELNNPLTTEENCGYTYRVPVIEIYKGAEFDFYVTANDTNDCTELTLDSTGLPSSRDAEVYGRLVEGIYSTFSDEEMLVDYPEFPEGMVLRKRFNWEAPPGSGLDPALDTRPELSKVCFYGFDKYLLTNQPFYCLMLKIVYEPVVIEELEPCVCRTCSVKGKRGNVVPGRKVPNYAPKWMTPE